MNSKLQPPTKTEDIFKVHIADLSDKHKESSPPRASTRKAPARSSNRYEPYNKPPAKTKQTESKPAKVASKPTKVASKPAKPTAKAASKPAPKKTEEPPAKKTKRAAWDTYKFFNLEKEGWKILNRVLHKHMEN